jgi:hypothetical protein
VRATRNWIRAEGDQVQVTERAQGEFGCHLFLRGWLNRDDITATYENGVLTITSQSLMAPPATGQVRVHQGNGGEAEWTYEKGLQSDSAAELPGGRRRAKNTLRMMATADRPTL